jgi:Spy/CpxP family protein refolding chaperone
MKNILATLLFVLTLVVSLNVQSQNADRFPMLRERIIQAKLREIKLTLNLDQATFEQFRPIYLKYEREVSGVDFRKLGRLMKVESDSLSTEEADQLIVNQLESARKLINIREKYYKEFRTVITPQQIIKLYQTEAELRKKVMQELKRRMMSR